MNAIILPGNSVSNRQWGTMLQVALLPVFKGIHRASYEHWFSGAPIIDIAKELGRLFSGDEEKLIVESPYIIIAKSAGVLIGAKGIFEGRLAPNKCVFIGSAIWWGEEIGCPVWQWFEKFKIPTLFIQNMNDPVMSSRELRHFLVEAKVAKWHIHELPGHDHDYSDIKILETITKQFITEG